MPLDISINIGETFDDVAHISDKIPGASPAADNESDLTILLANTMNLAGANSVVKYLIADVFNAHQVE